MSPEIEGVNFFSFFAASKYLFYLMVLLIKEAGDIEEMNVHYNVDKYRFVRMSIICMCKIALKRSTVDKVRHPSRSAGYSVK